MHLNKPRALRLVAVWAVMAVLSMNAWGATPTSWTGANSVNWNDAGNWSGGLPAFDKDVTLTSAGTFRPSNQDIAALSINSLTFTGATAFSLGGQPITILAAGTGLSVDPASADFSVNLNVVLGAAQTWTIGAGRTFTMNGAISGNASFTKDGAGTYLHGGLNTYTGSTAVLAGTYRLLAVQPPQALYTFDNVSGATVVNEGSLGTTKNATLNGGAAITTGSGGKRGEAGTFPSQSALLTVMATGGKALDVNGTAFTAMTWFNGLYGTGNWRTLLRGGDSFGTGDHEAIIEAGSWRLGFYGNAAGGAFRPAANPVGSGNFVDMSAFQTGWHHIAVVGNGAVTDYYVDGIYRGTADRKSNTDISAIGNYLTGTQAYAQRLDDFIFYTRALSAAEISGHFAATPNFNATNMLPSGTNLTLGGGATLDWAAGVQTLGSITGAAGSFMMNGTLTSNTPASTTFAGNYSGAGSLTKNGAGTLTYSGTNTYTGTTTINGGTLQAAGVGTLPSNSTVSLTNNGILDLTGTSQTLGGLSGTAGTQVLLGGNASTVLTVGTNNQSSNFFGVISGSGSFTKVGTGTLGILTAQTYSGNTSINGGTVSMAPQSDALAYYSFDSVSGGTVNNAGTLGSSRNALMVGGAAITSASGGKFGEGLSLPSQSALLQAGNVAGKAIDLSGSPYTAMCWFNGLYGTGNWRTLFRGGDTGGIGDHQAIIENGAWRLGFYGNLAGGGFRPAANPVGSANFVDMSVYQTGWHHFAVVGSGTVSDYYIDGVYRGTADRKSNSDITAIGNYLTGTQVYSQKLDDVYVYGRAFAPAEILAVFNAAPPPPGTNFLPPNALSMANGGQLDLANTVQTFMQLNGTLGTGVITNNPFTLNDGGVDATFLGNISGSGSLVKNGGGTLTLGGKCTYAGSTALNGGTLKLQGGLAQDAAGYYSFDSVSGTTVNNQASAGPVKNGTLIGPATITTGSGGKYGEAMQLPATQAAAANAMMQIMLTGGKGIDLAGGNWTATAWFNGIYPLGLWRTLFRGNGNDHQVIIQDSTYQVGMYDNATGTGFRSSTYTVNTPVDVQTGWHHLAVVGTGVTQTIYIDGVAVGAPIPVKSISDIFAVGNIQTGGQPFAQRIDDVYIFQRALSATEVQNLYNNIPNGGSNVLPVGTTFTMAANTTLNVNAVNQTIGSLAGGANTQVQLGSGTLLAGFNNSSTTYSGTVAGPGTFGKSGTGAMTISNSLTTVTGVTVAGGTLNLPSANATSATCAVTIGTGATLDSTNFVQTFGSLAGDAGGRLLMGTVPVLTVGGNNTNTVFAGQIIGTCDFTKVGTGVLTFAGPQLYTGNTNINAGTLRLAGLPGGAAAIYTYDSVAGATVTNAGSAGATKNGTLTNGAVVTSGSGGKRGEAMSVPNNNAFMSIALTNSRGIDLAGGAWTASAWYFNMNPVGLWRTLFRGNVSDHQVIVQDTAYMLGSYDNAFGFRPSGYNVNTPNDVQAGWHHICAVGTGTQTIMYIDGNPIGTCAFKSIADIAFVGNYQGGGQPFAQRIDEVYLYQRALSAAEVTALFSFSSQAQTEVLPATAVNLGAGATLDVGGGTQTLAQFNGNATSSILLTGGTLILGSGNNSFTYSGNISGAGGQLQKAGTGTMTLTGNNTYTGGTIVSSGVLQGNATGVQGNIVNNASVVFDQPGAGTYGGNMSGTGSMTKQNTGTLTLSGSSTYAGATNITGGTLRLAPAFNLSPDGYYSFDSVAGSTVNNGGTLGSAKNATLMGGAGITTGSGGIKGEAMTLPSQSALLQIIPTAGKGIDFNGTPYTMTVWFNGLYNTASWRTLYRGGDSAGTGDHQLIIEQGSWRLGLYGNAAGGAFRPCVNPPPGGAAYSALGVSTGWHNVAIVGSGTTTDFYIDGVYVGTADRKSNTDVLTIGNYLTGTQVFSQRLDEVYVFRRALSAAEVVKTYQFSGNIPITASDALPSGTAVSISGGGMLDLNNFSQTIGSLAGVGGTFVTLGSGTLTTGGNNSATTFGGQISGTGGVTKMGTGKFTLGGASIFSGATTVQTGSLEVTNGAGSATGTGAVTVRTGATLTGNGIVTSAVAVNSGGIVAPGSNLGKLSTGALAPVAGAITNFELVAADNGATNTGGDDEMAVTGNLTLAGTLNVTSPGSLTAGTYHLYSYSGTLSGTFSTFTAPGGFDSAIDTSTPGSVNLFLNHRPVLTAIPPQSVNEGSTLTFTASATDADAGQTLTYSIQPPVPAGAAIDPVTGAFSWTPTDGPGQSQNVTIRVTDNGPGSFFAQQAVIVTVNNVAPTAAFSSGGPVTEGSTGTVTFSGQADVSSVDSGSLRYSYDFDNSGSFDLGGATYATANTNASVTVPASFLDDGPAVRTIRGRIWDKDGGFTDYTTTIAISNVAPSAGSFTNGGDVPEGAASAAVTVNAPFDPSTADRATLHYSYDFDYDGVTPGFDFGGATYLAATTFASATVPAAFLDDGPLGRVVLVRVFDKDGASADYTTTINILSVAPTAAMAAITGTTEGSTTTVSMGGQFDPSGADTNAGFKYSYDYNYDGVTPAFDLGGIDYATAVSNSNPTIPASQIADGPAAQTVLARIWDKDGSFTDYTQTFTIANVAPTLTNLNAAAIAENGASILTGTLVDPGILDTFTVTIDWGDPLSPNNVEIYNAGSNAGGSQSVLFTHQYLDDNPTATNSDAYTITITVTDNDNGSDTLTTSVTVTDANPVVSTPNGLQPHIPEHSTTGLITVATFTDAGFLDTHTATIDWGDGSPLDLNTVIDEPSAANNWIGSVQGSHLFDDGPDVSPVLVTVLDDDGGSGSASFFVLVDNVAPTATFQRPDTASFDPLTSVEFVNSNDVSDADRTAGFLYSYDFNNDGAFEVSFTNVAAMAIPAQFLSVHNIVRGRITDKDGGFSDYLLQQPYFATEFLEVTFNLGESSSYTIPALGEPKPVFVLTAVDLPAIAPTLEALGLSFDGVDKVTGVPTLSGMVTIHILASNAGGQVAIDLLITIIRPSGGSNTPKVISEATATPNPAIAGTPVEFSVVATDSDGDVLSYFWDFRDGTTARGRVTTHIFTQPGKYDVVMVVSDGKHEVSQHFTVTISGIGEASGFDIATLKLTFDFRKPAKSTLYMTGFMPVPSGSLTGLTADVAIPGSLYAQSFVLDSKGAGGDTMSLFSVKVIQTGSLASRAKFVFSLKSTDGLDPLKPSLHQKLVMLGYTSGRTADPKGDTITMPISIKVGVLPPSTKDIPTLYRTAPQRSGKAALKK